MLITTSNGSAPLSSAGRSLEAALPLSTKQPQPLAARDHVEVSDEAQESSRTKGRHGHPKPDSMMDLLKGILTRLTGSKVEEVTPTPEGAAPGAPQPPLAAGYQQSSLTTESLSLSLNGTIATKDGKQLGFSLSLQHDHASLTSQTAQVQTGKDGLSLSFSGTSAELSSTSFSFTLSSSADSRPAGGKGSFQLNDEVSTVAKQLKPLLKEFMKATGMNGG